MKIEMKIRLFVNNILGVQTHNIRNIFFLAVKQLIVSKTLFLFWWRKLIPKKFVKKWKTTQHC